MEKINDYIVVFENVMAQSLCDAILEEYKAEHEWQKTLIGNQNTVNTDIRSAETIPISYLSVINKNPDIREKIDKYIFSAAGTVIKQYNEKFPFSNIEEDSGYELLRYKEGDFYTQHVDSFKTRQRAVSCSFALNDDYEGGEWGFFNRELIFKLPKGAALLFPSNFMYPHEIIPVTKGARFSVITWFV
jgi:Rps23 Pro-64 3,4-dihydroxylase Tpa1-like proline 4-hydroxylase